MPGTARRWKAWRGATAEQLVEHLRCGTVYSSVAQAWRAAMADAKVEDTVLVWFVHTVAQVMEEIDAGESVASKFQNRLVGIIVLVALG